MENEKQTFLEALKGNNGKLDELSLGTSLGFTEIKTKQIIDELVKEGKIEFQSFGLCSYRTMK
jgi:polyhydroxyalkanoate synthesis regulator phasin